MYKPTSARLINYMGADNDLKIYRYKFCIFVTLYFHFVILLIPLTLAAMALRDSYHHEFKTACGALLQQLLMADMPPNQ